MSQFGPPVQDGTIGAGISGVPTNTTNSRYTNVDESSVDTADYIQSGFGGSNATQTFNLLLGRIDDPGVNTGHVLTIVTGKSSSGGSQVYLDLSLYCNGVEVVAQGGLAANYPQGGTNVGPFTATLTLTGGQVDIIRANGGYGVAGALELRFRMIQTYNAVSGSRQIRLYQTNIVTPDRAGQIITGASMSLTAAATLSGVGKYTASNVGTTSATAISSGFGSVIFSGSSVFNAINTCNGYGALSILVTGQILSATSIGAGSGTFIASGPIVDYEASAIVEGAGCAVVAGADNLFSTITNATGSGSGVFSNGNINFDSNAVFNSSQSTIVLGPILEINSNAQFSGAGAVSIAARSLTFSSIGESIGHGYITVLSIGGTASALSNSTGAGNNIINAMLSEQTSVASTSGVGKLIVSGSAGVFNVPVAMSGIGRYIAGQNNMSSDVSAVNMGHGYTSFTIYGAQSADSQFIGIGTLIITGTDTELNALAQALGAGELASQYVHTNSPTNLIILSLEGQVVGLAGNTTGTILTSQYSGIILLDE